MKFLTALVFALLTVSSPALANWQYTKWGMTPDAVVAASGGIASKLSEADIAKYSLTDGSQRALLSAPYSSGELQFSARFLFNSSQQLSSVELDMYGAADHLEGALRAKYGTPREDHSLSFGRVIFWDSGNEQIRFLSIGDHGTVEYSPRATANNKGL